jgi:oligopeptide/dipeptide ABC transporter ATP-binding protein
MVPNNLLQVDNLKKYFPIERGVLRDTIGQVKAVDGVSFVLKEAETLGLVGESGCGKSTLARVILRLLPSTSGSVLFEGINLFELKSSKMRGLRKKMQIIFQDPIGCLNPRHTIEFIVGEPLAIHRLAKDKERRMRVLELLNLVGLSSDSLSRYPHEFSGGQRQRIGIARALATNPKFIVADEPVSSLDVSIAGQIINLLRDLQERLALTYLFISHDLRMVEYISNRVAVMYAGKIVELATKEEIYRRPMHFYTRALLEAVPTLYPKTRRSRLLLSGDLPNLTTPQGCPFHPRCQEIKPECKEIEPELIEIQNGHFLACHHIFSC